MRNLIDRIFKRQKRKDQRFIVDDYELVIYDYNVPAEKEIVDLSLGGISLVYVDDGNRLGETFELEIKIGDAFHLGKIRAKTISDSEVGEITGKFKTYRRLSARFINLDAIQEYELRRILKKYGKAQA